jgi:hypothetical protein
MKNKILLLFLFINVLLFSQVAVDHAGNYLSWSNGSNLGSGFSAWSLTNTGSAGHFLGSSSSQGFGNIDVSSKSFGMYGNPSGGNFSNARRTFNYTIESTTYTSLQNGHTFRIELATAYRNGNKGLDIDVGGVGKWNFNVGSDIYAVQSVDQGWAYSQTSIFVIEVTQISATNAHIRVTRGGDIYEETNFNLTGRLTGINLYCANTEAGNLNNLFFNNLSIRTDSPLPVQLSSFSANIINKSVNLKWQTAIEQNNYGFEIERSLKSVVGSENSTWQSIGFVNGNGNSNSPKEYSYTDNSLNNSGKYSYRLKQVDNDGSYEYSSVVEVDYNPVITFELAQNYPNPFNPSTSISYSIPNAEFVSIKVFNLIGEEVATLFNGYIDAGKHTVTFDASKLSSGMYLYKITAGNFTQVKKMLLAK